jgi:hypothetical protein
MVPADGVTWSHLLGRGFVEGLSRAALARDLEDAVDSDAGTRDLARAVLRELGSVGRGGLGRAVAMVTCAAAVVTGVAVAAVVGARAGGGGSIAEAADHLERAGRRAPRPGGPWAPGVTTPTESRMVVDWVRATAG